MKDHREAQKELYDRYCVQMKGICMRFASSETEAEDLLQESFIRVFTGLKKYTSGSLGAWIRTITINTAIEFYRKQKTRREHYDNLSLSSVDEELVLDHIALEDLLKKIQSLPNGYRVVFNLYEIEGYNHREIGEKLGISEGTSKSQLARAKQVLREQLTAEENYERNQLKNVE